MLVARGIVAGRQERVHEDCRGWIGGNHLLDEVVVTASVHNDDVGFVYRKLIASRGFKRVRVLVGIGNERGDRGGVAGDQVCQRAPNVGACHDFDWAGACLPTGGFGGASGE